VTHGAAAACVVRGADMAVGRHRRREVAAACVACGGREAGGTRQSGSWSGRDAALAVGVGARSKRRDRNGSHAHACKPAIRWA
jgi:hypothetical protein